MYPKIDRAALDALVAQKKPKISRVDLTDIDLQRPPVDFSGAHIEECTLSNLDLRGLSFRKATLKHCWIDGAVLEGADFAGAKLVGSFGTAKLARARFVGANLAKAEFISADLRGADLAEASCPRVNFLYANLAGASFRGADLEGASFEKATTDGADFTGAAGYTSGPARTTLTASTGGGPLLVVPAGAVASWNGPAGDADRADAPEGTVTVCGWVETSSIAVPNGRALVLGGELDTAFVPTDTGGVLVRGGDFDDERAREKAVKKALGRKKGWVAHDQPFASDGEVWIFEAALRGAATPEELGADYGVVTAPLPTGTYSVDVLGTDDASGPVVFVRLGRR